MKSKDCFRLFLQGVAATFLITLPVAGALSKPHQLLDPMEGNWYVEFYDSPKKGDVLRHRITMERDWQLLCNGNPFNGWKDHLPRTGAMWSKRPNPEASWELSGSGGCGGLVTVTNNKIHIAHGYYCLGHWGGSSEVQQTGPNEIKGKWKYGDGGGNEVWKRSIARVTEVEYISSISNRVDVSTPGRAESIYSSWGNDMRGNRPGFEIRLYGEHLWGRHQVWIEGVDLETKAVYPINRKLPDGTSEVIGLSIPVIVWPKASSGRKYVHIDGNKIPFDMVIKGAPPENYRPKAELRFVRFTDGRFESAGDLRHGDDFYVEARYKTKPDVAPDTIELAWSEARPYQVELKPTDDPKLFRSKQIRLTAPTSK